MHQPKLTSARSNFHKFRIAQFFWPAQNHQTSSSRSISWGSDCSILSAHQIQHLQKVILFHREFRLLNSWHKRVLTDATSNFTTRDCSIPSAIWWLHSSSVIRSSTKKTIIIQHHHQIPSRNSDIPPILSPLSSSLMHKEECSWWCWNLKPPQKTHNPKFLKKPWNSELMIDHHHHTWKFSKNWIELLMQVMELNPKKKIFEGPRMWWAECVWNDSETSFFLLCFCNCLVMKIIINNNNNYYYYYFPYQLTSCLLFALCFSKVLFFLWAKQELWFLLLLLLLLVIEIVYFCHAFILREFYFIFGWKFACVESKLNVNKVQINSCLWGGG
jgi:hypothetical protein